MNEAQQEIIDKLAQLNLDKSASERPLSSRKVLLGATLFLALMLGYYWWQHQGDIVAATSSVQQKVQQAPANQPVTPTKVSGSEPTGGLEVKGFAIVEREAALSSAVAGVVKSVLVSDGAYVDEGQTLVVLDQELQRAQISQSETSIILAKQKLRMAENTLSHANLKLSRMTKIGKQNQIAAEIEDQHSLIAGLMIAREQAQLEIDAALKLHNTYLLNLDKTLIKAPFSGFIVNVTVQPGEVVSPLSAVGAAARSGIGLLFDPRSIKIKTEVSELYLSKVAVGQQVSIVPDAYPDLMLTGFVDRISKVANKGMASVNVYVALQQTNEKLLPNMAVSVNWTPEHNLALASKLQQGQ